MGAEGAFGGKWKGKKGMAGKESLFILSSKQMQQGESKKSDVRGVLRGFVEFKVLKYSLRRKSL